MNILILSICVHYNGNGLFTPDFSSQCFAVHCFCVRTKITLANGGNHSVIIHENKRMELILALQ